MIESKYNCLLMLQKWYFNQCNGGWENKFGVRIDTIDNPGWSIRIDLKDTKLENEKFNNVRINISDENWIFCWLKEKVFQGGGAPQNLIDLINIFLEWAENNVTSKRNSLIDNVILIKLQEWYKNQCNGDWEHEFGIKIDTMDNPGWTLTIDLTNTCLEEKTFNEIDMQANELNWIQCEVKNRQFLGSSGPKNLTKLIEIFIDWAC